MTKEELLIKHCGYPSITEVNGVRVTSNVENAMEEWAKQQAIEFGKWIQGCNYAPATESNKWQNQIMGENDIVTTEELHDQFIEQQSKEQ
jgi:hypothetical protein